MTGGAARNAASRCGSEELTAGREEGGLAQGALWAESREPPVVDMPWTGSPDGLQLGPVQRPWSSLEASCEAEPGEDWAGELESQVRLLEDNTPTCKDFASRVPCPAVKCLCPSRPLWVIRVVGVRGQDDVDAEEAPLPPAPPLRNEKITFWKQLQTQLNLPWLGAPG